MGKSISQIAVCSEQDRKGALRLVLRTLPTINRRQLMESLATVAAEPLGAFDALIIAKRARRLFAATWVQPQPGRTASLWLPESYGALSESDAIAMIERATQIADQHDVSMTQVLLPTEGHPLKNAITSNGFHQVAVLLYLEWPPQEITPGAKVESTGQIEFESHADHQPQRLAQIVQSTYIDTLDCPQLEGLRSVADTLGGYKQVGEYDPALWYVIRRNGLDVGALLLAEHPSTKQMELVYMGVSPAARGTGVGEQAIRKAQQLAGQRGAERLVLAVDSANTPAMRLYQAAGFTEWAARVAFIRPRGGGDAL